MVAFAFFLEHTADQMPSVARYPARMSYESRLAPHPGLLITSIDGNYPIVCLCNHCLCHPSANAAQHANLTLQSLHRITMQGVKSAKRSRVPAILSALAVIEQHLSCLAGLAEPVKCKAMNCR